MPLPRPRSRSAIVISASGFAETIPSTHSQWIEHVPGIMAMRKQLMIVLFSLMSIVISSEAAAGKWTTSTITYNGLTYQLSSSSTCLDGTAALRYMRKWWCPVSATVAITPPPTTTPTEPVAYSAQISWTIPSTRTDGTPLPLSELTGYEIYYTTDDPAVTGVVNVTGGSSASYVASNLKAGNYYFTISAIDINGLKSSMSTMAAIKFGP
jgi:hypothetical protein